MALLDDIRSKYQWAQSKSGYEIADMFSRKTGRPFALVAMDLGVELPSSDKTRNPITAGLASGIDQAQGLGYSALAAGGDLVGLEGLKNFGLRGSSANRYESEAAGRPDLERLEDQTLGSAIPFAAYQVSKQVPNIAAAIGGSLLVPEAAIPAAFSRGAALLPKALGGGGLRTGASIAERRLASEAGRDFAKTAVAGTATEGTMGAGSMYQESVEAGNPDAAGALLGAIPYGAVGALTPAALKGLFTRGSGFSGGVASRVGKALGINAVGEGAVEGVQNEMEMSFNPYLTQEEIDSRRLNSIGIGALVGGTFGAGGGLRSNREPINLVGKSREGFADDTQDFNIAQNVVPATGLQPIDIINANTGVNRTKQDRKGYEKALGTEYNEPSDVRVVDPTTQTEVILTKGQALARQAGATLEEVLGKTAPAPAAPVWNFIDPDTQTLLPAPKDAGIKSNKKVEAYTLIADARSKGLMTAEDFVNTTNEIEGTKKIGKVLPKIVAKLQALTPSGESNENVSTNDQRISQSTNQSTNQSQVKSTGQGQVVNVQNAGQGQEVAAQQLPNNNPNTQVATQTGPSPTTFLTRNAKNLAELDVNAVMNAPDNGIDLDLTKKFLQFRSRLAATQKPVFDVMLDSLFNFSLDRIIDKNGDLMLSAIRDISGVKSSDTVQKATDAVLKKLTETVPEAQAMIRDRIRTVIAANPAIDSTAGLSPSMQPSVLDIREITEDEEGNGDAGSNMGVIKSVGATDTDLSSVTSNNTRAQDAIMNQATEELRKAGALDSGKNVVVEDSDNTINENALRAAKESKAELHKFLLESPDSRAALNDWDPENPIKLSDFEEQDMIEYLSEYIELVNSQAFADMSGQRQNRAIEMLQETVANTVKERLFNGTETKLQSNVGANESGTESNPDTGTVQRMGTNSPIEGSYYEDSGDTQQRGTGTQGTNTPTVIVKKSRKLKTAPAVESVIAEEVVEPANTESAVETANIAAAEALDIVITPEEIKEEVSLAAEITQAVEESLAPEEIVRVEEYYETTGEVAVKQYSAEFADWLYNGAKKVGHELYDLFQKTLNSLRTGVLSVAMIVNMTPTVPLVDMQVPVTKFAIKQVVERPKADFGDFAAPDEVRLVADWQLSKNKGVPTIIVDKLNGLTYVVGKDGKVVGKSAALTGVTPGDTLPASSASKNVDELSVSERVTPAGEYSGKRIPNQNYGTVVSFKQLDKFVIAMHQVSLSNPSENRAARLDSATPFDNRISFGCVNVPKAFYDNVVAPITPMGAPVSIIVMPEEVSLETQFKDIRTGEKIEKTVEVTMNEGKGSATANKANTSVGMRQNDTVAPAIKPFASKGRSLTSEEKDEGGVASAIEDFYSAGLGGILVDMKSMNVATQKDRGLFDMTSDGQFTVTLQQEMIDSQDEMEIAFVVRHELSHALDYVLGWNLSGHPNLKVEVLDDGSLRYEGVVAREIEALRSQPRTGVAADLSDYLGYPLDRSINGELSAFRTQAEIFAQLQAVWLTKDGRQKLRTFLPKTARFMEAANEHAKNEIRQGNTLNRSETSSSTRTNAGKPTVAGSNQETTRTENSEKGLASRGFSLNNSGNDYLQRAQSTGTDSFKKLNYAMRNLSPKLLTSTQLLEQYGGKIKSLKTYLKAQNEMGAMASQLREASSKLLESWGTYAVTNKPQNELLMSVMHDATQSGIHPDVAFNDPTNAHLTAKDLALYNQLSTKYKALPNAARKLYKDSKALLSNNWKLRQEIYAEVVSSAYDPRIAEATKNGDTKTAAQLTRKRDNDISDHAKQVKELRGPYFPLLRFGDYIVVAESNKLVTLRKEMETADPTRYKELAKQAAVLEQDGKHYVVEAFESRLDMENRKNDLNAKGFETYERKAEAYSQEARPVTAAALDKLDGALSAGFDKQTANKLKDLVTEMYVAALPEHHALQRQIRRKGVQGADANMMRAFAETIERDSFYLSRMKYAKELSKSMNDMRQETRRMSVDEQNVYNNVVDRATADYKYERTPVIGFLARMSSIYHLGVSPAFLLTNMTQPWFITVPQLAGTHGATKTFAAMRSGWMDATRIIKQGKGGTMLNLVAVDLSTIQNPGERKMLERLRDVNKLDSTQLLDMGMLSNGMSPYTMKASKVFNWATHHIELTNRISTALATYRLERARNPSASQETLIEKAINMVDLTQLDYSNENAAYFMKPGVGLGKLNKIIFQFRKYQQGMIYLLGRNAKLAFAGDKEAGKALGYLMGTQLLFAGVSGLPITAPLLFAAYMIAGDDDDEDGDLETQIRNYASDLIGPDAARVLWKGLPTALGVDISANVGMGGLFKPFPMMAANDITNAKTGEDAIKELLFNTAGAPVAMVAKLAEGAISISNGEWARGIAQITPRFVASVVKAGDLAANGVNTRSGTQVMTADQFDAWDIALKAAGFNPSDLTEHYAAQTVKENTSNAIQDRRNMLMKKYAVAKLKGESVADIKADILEFNKDHPKVKLDQSALLRAIQTRKKGSKEVDEAGVRYRANESSLKGISRFAY